MHYVFGLGNPGKQYEQTPHNIGRELLQEMVRTYPHDFSQWEKDGKSHVAYGTTITEDPLQLILPDTFMNLSGEVLTSDMKKDAEKIIVVYDDIDLPFGEIRISHNRGSGGHNGIKSIEQHVKSRSFIRLRVGVCPLGWLGHPHKPQGKDAVNRYLVNKKLSTWYSKQYTDLALKIHQRIDSIVGDGVIKAMNKHN